jgi:hypothetical protein
LSQQIDEKYLCEHGVCVKAPDCGGYDDVEPLAVCLSGGVGCPLKEAKV